MTQKCPQAPYPLFPQFFLSLFVLATVVSSAFASEQRAHPPYSSQSSLSKSVITLAHLRPSDSFTISENEILILLSHLISSHSSLPSLYSASCLSSFCPSNTPSYFLALSLGTCCSFFSECFSLKSLHSCLLLIVQVSIPISSLQTSLSVSRFLS